MNKHDLDLRAAFPEMPDDCRTALLFAARSVKEEKKMKRMTFRTVLIAALLIITTMTAALAATGALGWTDFFKTYYNVEVTKPAQDVLNATPEETWQVGPMTFTLRQLLCDGHLAMAATAIRTTDGSPALYCFDPFDSLGCNGENGVALSQRLGLDPETTYLDAAKQLNLPLYSPRAILDITGEYMDGEGMEDPLWNEDNTVTYFSMAALDLEKPTKEQLKRLDYYGAGTVTVTVRDQYYNMREQVEPHYHVVEKAVRAMELAGVKPKIQPIRGGTDGANLSFKGLPCPNIFAGGLNFHGKFEWVPLESMEKAAAVIRHLIALYAE